MQRPQLGGGFLVGALTHLPAQVVLAATTGGIGVTQLVYLVPLALLAVRNSAPEMAKGLWLMVLGNF